MDARPTQTVTENNIAIGIFSCFVYAHTKCENIFETKAFHKIISGAQSFVVL